MTRWARQARNISRYSCTRFCFFLACSRLSGLMFSRPIKTRLHPARAAFSMKFGMRWQRVSTWMMNCSPSPSRSRISIKRSKIASQFRLRAKLSSVMKNRKTPCARLARTSRSTSSASRQRDLRPCTLMIVQKLHWNGQPRAGVEGTDRFAITAHDVERQKRRHLLLQRGQVVHVVVDRGESPSERIGKDLGEPPLGLAGKEAHPEPAGCFEV